MRLSKIIASIEDLAIAHSNVATDAVKAGVKATKWLATEVRSDVHQLRVQLRAKRLLKQLALDNEALAYLAMQSKEG